MFKRLIVTGLLTLVIQDTLLVKRTLRSVNWRGFRSKRDLNSEWEKTIAAIEGLRYDGNISSEPQEGELYASTRGEVLQYTTPSENIPLQYKEAIALCTTRNARIWDQDPQLGLGFDNIKFGQNYSKLFKQIKQEWESLTNQIKNIEMKTEIETNEEKIKKLEEQVETIKAIERNIVTKDMQTNNRRGILDNDSSSGEEEEEEEGHTQEPGPLEKIFRHMKEQQQSLQTFCNNWNFDCKHIIVGSLVMTMIWGAGMIIVMIMAIKTCCIAKKMTKISERIKRIQKHRDLKDTEDQQE